MCQAAILAPQENSVQEEQPANPVQKELPLQEGRRHVLAALLGMRLCVQAVRVVNAHLDFIAQAELL